jgi:hypothetical protein
VPALHTQPYHFVIGQALFLSLALVLWYMSRRRPAAERKNGIRLD